MDPLPPAERRNHQRLLEILSRDEESRKAKANGLSMLFFGLPFMLGLWAGTAWWLMLLIGAVHDLWLPAMPTIGWWAAVGLVGLGWAGPAAYRVVKAAIKMFDARTSKLAAGEEAASSPTGWLAVYENGSWLPVDRFDDNRTPMVYAVRFDPAHLTDAALIEGFIRLAPCKSTDAATPQPGAAARAEQP